jgi:hypothetical protein
MATDYEFGNDISLLAAADLSDYQYHIVMLSAPRTVSYSTADADAAIGILQDKPEAANRACKVRTTGVSKLKIGSGGITDGAKIASDATGKGVAASANERYLAIALEDGDENDIISVLLERGNVPSA